VWEWREGGRGGERGLWGVGEREIRGRVVGVGWPEGPRWGGGCGEEGGAGGGRGGGRGGAWGGWGGVVK